MNWEIISQIATPVAVIVAFIVFVWQVFDNKKQKIYERSKFNLESARAGFEKAIKILSEGKNDRVLWITAARILKRSDSIAKIITEKEHKNVFEIEMEGYRRALGDILGFDNHELRPSFFYGVSDFELPINEAAAKSSMPQEKDNFQVSTCRAMSESALWTIWQFVQFPKDYDEPIKGEFPDELVEEMGPRWVDYPALFEYLKHTRRYASIGGKLVEIEKK